MRLLLTLCPTLVVILCGCNATPEKTYTSIAHDGRIYVVGSPESAMKFKKEHHLPLTKTMIGAGPNGETIVVEASSKDPEMANQLWMDYAKDNLRYFERFHNGRTYILGSLESVHKFEETSHLPLTKTYIGEGVSGETVIVEESKTDPMLANNLWAMYKGKYKK